MLRKVLVWIMGVTLGVSACGSAPTAVPATPTVSNPPTAGVYVTNTPAAPESIVVMDGLGRTLNLPTPAQRIVSLAPSNTEIVFAVGAGSQLVGREEFSDYPPEAVQVPSVGSLYPKVNLEAILALKPDLVLAAGITNPDDVEAMTKVGLTVYAARNATTLDDIYADILAIGELSGHQPSAQALVSSMVERVGAVTAKVIGLTPHPKVYYEIDATDPAKPYTAGQDSFIDQLLTLAGGDNIGRAGQGAYFQISLEELVAQNPAVIVLGSSTYGGQTPQMVAARAGWGSIKAVQTGAIYLFDDNLVSRPGPRVVEGLEALAKLIHPEAFK